LSFDPDAGAWQAALLDEANAGRGQRESTIDWLTGGGWMERTSDGLAATREILVAGYGRLAAAERLRGAGWTVIDQAGDITRFAHPTARMPEIERTCAGLRALGLAADPNYIVIAGGAIKFTTAMAQPTGVRPRPWPGHGVINAGYVKFTKAVTRPTDHHPQPRPASIAGAGVRVAVLDTGIDPRAVHAEHGWLAGIAVDAANYEGPDDGGLLGPATGHGTFCAGIVRQVAPACDIQAIRVLDANGTGTDYSVARALFALAASDDPPQIVNLSLTAASGRPPIAIESALSTLSARHPHVTVVAAAGNDGRSAPAWPAAARTVVAVGSPAAYSNRGRWVDIEVPAEGVVSTSVEGVRAGVDGLVEHRRPYAAWTGTSFAAPQVAGALAVLASHGRRPASVAQMVC
jgi:subtilisin family serine protease